MASEEAQAEHGSDSLLSGRATRSGAEGQPEAPVYTEKVTSWRPLPRDCGGSTACSYEWRFGGQIRMGPNPAPLGTVPDSLQIHHHVPI